MFILNQPAQVTCEEHDEPDENCDECALPQITHQFHPFGNV